MVSPETAAVQYGTCKNCDCREFEQQKGNKRCRGCGHGQTLHNAITESASTVGNIKLSFKDRLRLVQRPQRTLGASFYIWRNFILWSVITILILPGLLLPRLPITFDRGVADDWYVCTASAFALAIAYSAIAHAHAKTKEKRRLTKVLCCVNGIALASYLLQIFRLTPTFMDYVGHPVDPSRFLEWLATCPVLIYLISEITRNHGMASTTATYDYALIIAGFFASAMKQPYSEIFATISTCFFIHTLWNLMHMYDAAIEGKTKSRLNKESLRSAKYVTFGAWWAFTISWYIQRRPFITSRSKIVTYEQGEICFCVSDIFAKVFLTLILVNATIEESQEEIASRIEGISGEIEQQMQQADRLLEKLMPAGLIEQLKSGKATGAEEFESVTVFFSDITNFAELSKTMSTKDMLATLNKLWQEYDVLAKRWGIYKVETIGDAFLGVVGAPDRVPDHASRAVSFAL
ncbi:Nitrogen permease regulator 2, partial [Irineochytrium annulatum]